MVIKISSLVWKQIRYSFLIRTVVRLEDSVKNFKVSFFGYLKILETLWNGKKGMLVQTIGGKYRVGRILSAIATATMYPDVRFIFLQMK